MRQVRQLLEPGILPKLIVVRLIHHVDRLEGNTIRVFLFQIVREVPIQDIAQYRLSIDRQEQSKGQNFKQRNLGDLPRLAWHSRGKRASQRS